MQIKRALEATRRAEKPRFTLRGLLDGSHNKKLSAIMKGRGPFQLDDLISQEGYEAERPSLLREGRKIKTKRRMRLGPNFSLLFENRASVWLQIQEELRWINRPAKQRAWDLLDRYNQLLVHSDQLCATLFLDSKDPQTVEHYVTSYTVEELMITLKLGGSTLRAQPLEPTSGQIEAVTYLRFVCDTTTSQIVDTIEWSDPVPHEQPLTVDMSSSLRADLDRSPSNSSLSSPAEHVSLGR